MATTPTIVGFSPDPAVPHLIGTSPDQDQQRPDFPAQARSSLRGAFAGTPPPPMPAAPRPPGAAALDEQARAAVAAEPRPPRSQPPLIPMPTPRGAMPRNPRTGQPETPPSLGAVPFLDTVAKGLVQTPRGAYELTQPGERERGAADLLEGAMKVGTAAVPEAALEAPAATALGLGAGYLGQEAAEHAARARGVSPDATRLIGDAAGLLAGGAAGGVEGLREYRAARASAPTVADAMANAENPALTSEARESEILRAQGLQQTPPGGKAAAAAAGAGAVAAREAEPETPQLIGTTEPAPELGGKIPGIPKPGGVGLMRTSALSTDPERFQYKLDAVGKGGTSRLLQGVGQYNPDLAGTISVWRDPENGQTYVVNGHHRFELAQRTGQPVVAVRRIAASDADAARRIGALQNIAEGRGTATDAAKFFRESGLGPDDLQKLGISMGERTAQQGATLAQLEPGLFSDLVRGRLRPGRALAVAEATQDPVEQRALVKLADAREEKTGKPVPDDVLAEMARLVKSSPQHSETEQTLFGPEEATRSLAFEKAEISAYIRRRLAQDQRLFATAGERRNAARLGEEGNQLDAEHNAEVARRTAQAQELYGALSSRVGPVAASLDDAATKLAGGENPDQVKREAYQQVRGRLSEFLGRIEEPQPVAAFSLAGKTDRARAAEIIRRIQRNEKGPEGKPLTTAEARARFEARYNQRQRGLFGEDINDARQRELHGDSYQPPLLSADIPGAPPEPGTVEIRRLQDDAGYRPGDRLIAIYDAADYPDTSRGYGTRYNQAAEFRARVGKDGTLYWGVARRLGRATKDEDAAVDRALGALPAGTPRNSVPFLEEGPDEAQIPVGAENNDERDHGAAKQALSAALEARARARFDQGSGAAGAPHFALPPEAEPLPVERAEKLPSPVFLDRAGTPHATLYLDAAGRDAMAALAGRTKLGALPRYRGMFLKPRLLDMLLAVPAQSPEEEQIQAAMRQYRLHGLPVVDYEHAATPFGRMRARLEEHGHQWQARADTGDPDKALGPQRALELFRAAPRAVRHVVAGYHAQLAGMPPEQRPLLVAAEIGARLLIGDYGDLGLGEEQGERLAKRWLNLVEQENGDDRIARAQGLAAPEIAGRARALGAPDDAGSASAGAGGGLGLGPGDTRGAGALQQPAALAPGERQAVGRARQRGLFAPTDADQGALFSLAPGAQPRLDFERRAEPEQGWYQRLMGGLMQKTGMGRSHPEVEAVDPELASRMRELDAAPQYFRAKAEANVKRVLGDLSRAQEKGFVLLADKATRDWLAENQPNEYEFYAADPDIRQALERYKPLEIELREARRELGGQVIEDDYLRRVYAAHTAGIGRKSAPGEQAAPFDRVITRQGTDRQQRTAGPAFYYRQGLHEFGPSYATRYVATMMKLIEDRTAELFESRATRLEPGEEPPRSIVYRGKTYYSPEASAEIREAFPRRKVDVYGAYAPAAGNARLAGRVAGLARAVAAMGARGDENARGQAYAALQELGARYLGPKKITDALMDYGSEQGAPGKFARALAPISRTIREQRVGFGFGIPHFFNIARRVAEQAPAGIADPRGWLDAIKVLLSRDLKARGVAGTDDPTFDRLLKHAGISERGAENFEKYAGGNLNPANWIQWLAKVGHSNLYHPGGIDQRARLWLADMLKAREPDWTDERIAERVNDVVGRTNRASWTAVQKAAGPYLVFPGWDFASMKWVLEHPIKTTVPMAVMVMLANRAIYAAGGNTKQDEWDPLAVHAGGRSYYPALLEEPFARHLAGVPLRAVRAMTRGKNLPQAIDFSRAPQDVGGTALNVLQPWALEPLEQTFNEQSPFTARAISSPSQARRWAMLLHHRIPISQATANRVEHAGESLIPTYGTLGNNMEGFDWRSLLGSSLGAPNYAESRRHRR